MLNSRKNLKAFALIFILSALVIATVVPNIATVKAQSQGSITMLTAAGGTTDPAMGSTTNYTDGTVVTLTATPGNGFLFQEWDIVSASGGVVDINNPTTLTVAGGSAYAVQPVFQPIQQAIPTAPTTNFATAAIVVVLSAVGGTTTPAAGTYALANAASLNLQANAATGFVFDHWVIGGSPLTHGAYSFTDTPTTNPYNVNHGYGNTYTYQPVFKPTSSSTSPTVPEYSSLATAGIIAVLLALAFGTYAYKRKTK